MSDPRFSKEWENKEVTVSRKEFGDIVVREVAAVLSAVDQASGEDPVINALFKELLFQFCAGIGAELFPEEDTITID